MKLFLRMSLVLAALLSSHSCGPHEVDYSGGGTPIAKVDYKGHTESRGYYAGDLQSPVPVGLWTRWHDNGVKSEEGWYVNGARDGTWTFWDENGVRAEHDFEDGEKVYSRHFDAAGWVSSEGSMLGDNKHGEWVYRFGPDHVETKTKFEHGVVVEQTVWHRSGAVRLSSESASKYFQSFTVYFENGNVEAVVRKTNLRRDGTIADDWTLHGAHRVYLENGDLDREKSGTYEYGEKVGELEETPEDTEDGKV